jgi:hypothetical protein
MKTKPKIVFIDIPRSQRDYVQYGMLEKIKDGLFCSGKYESTTVIMNPPHMIFMANFPPEMDPEKADVSPNRWVITRIPNGCPAGGCGAAGAVGSASAASTSCSVICDTDGWEQAQGPLDKYFE